ncbi:ferrochelatase [Corynebacterium aquatimens]|uniref:Coproporphyrin III ferrochelatase n=1 Tax=Corynebacterium aquatimens TaxID=1190508 RepID=A0A931DWM9_9CORY|nr:ferrochelatase [Corynebacterium aquatimens]MBG6121622.1 ferrochelatase [Corynebacterium aquatimens]WJY65839.1 Ferrochelatase [Corynebacterium aquatimens]
MSLHSFDALLVLSFGGPEGEDEVIPFLENVTRGRGIPRERLAEVGEHYFHFGGVSPLNEQNRVIIKNLEAEIATRGEELPVYFGNRNWHPFAAEAADQLAADGHTNIAVFATSAWGGYSACRQYDEDIAALKEQHPEMTFTKLWQFYGHPTFIDLVAAPLKEAWDAADQGSTRVLFSAHSVPNAADDAAGGANDSNLYSRQVEEASRLVAEKAGVGDYEIVWQSRSGNPATPWLEPDVCDRSEELADQGVKHVICVPIGFITDHMEVVWDLDTELQETCDEHGMKLTRTPTVGLDPKFSGLVLELLDAAAEQTAPETLSTITVQGCTVDGAPCKDDCCALVSHHGRS